jgi:hypothetical protein
MNACGRALLQLPRPVPVTGPGRAPLEQPGFDVVDAAHGVIVQGDAIDAAVIGQDLGLGLDLLGGEDPADRSQQWVSVEQFEVARELLDAVAGSADSAKSRARQNRWRQLQGVALSRSSFPSTKGLASPKVDALLGFSSSGVSPSR